MGFLSKAVCIKLMYSVHECYSTFSVQCMCTYTLLAEIIH